ncbi:hypothetical protein TKK_0015285 [Trichogramma kaykai]
MKEVKQKLYKEFSNAAKDEWSKLIKSIDYRESANFFPKINRISKPKGNKREEFKSLTIKYKHTDILNKCKINKNVITKNENNDYIVEDSAAINLIIGEFFHGINTKEANIGSPFEKLIKKKQKTQFTC